MKILNLSDSYIFIGDQLLVLLNTGYRVADIKLKILKMKTFFPYLGRNVFMLNTLFIFLQFTKYSNVFSKTENSFSVLIICAIC